MPKLILAFVETSHTELCLTRNTLGAQIMYSLYRTPKWERRRSRLHKNAGDHRKDPFVSMYQPPAFFGACARICSSQVAYCTWEGPQAWRHGREGCRAVTSALGASDVSAIGYRWAMSERSPNPATEKPIKETGNCISSSGRLADGLF